MKAQLHACKEVNSHKISEEKENQKNKFKNQNFAAYYLIRTQVKHNYSFTVTVYDSYLLN